MEKTTSTYSFFLMSRLVIKSLAVGVISSKASSSKSQTALVTFDRVSESESPINGDKPDNLKMECYAIIHCLRMISTRFDLMRKL